MIKTTREEDLAQAILKIEKLLNDYLKNKDEDSDKADNIWVDLTIQTGIAVDLAKNTIYDVPYYYQDNAGKMDLLEWLESNLSYDQVDAIYKMNVIKYAMRAGDKPGNSVENDIRKIIVYAKRWLAYWDKAPKWMPRTYEEDEECGLENPDTPWGQK